MLYGIHKICQRICMRILIWICTRLVFPYVMSLFPISKTEIGGKHQSWLLNTLCSNRFLKFSLDFSKASKFFNETSNNGEHFLKYGSILLLIPFNFMYRSPFRRESWWYISKETNHHSAYNHIWSNKKADKVEHLYAIKTLISKSSVLNPHCL